MASDPKSTDRDEREFNIAREREAMREILQVISRSRNDEGPVFEAILKAAARLCGVAKAGLMLGRPNGDYLTLAMLYDPDFPSAAARDAMIASVNDPPMRMNPDEHISAQAICSGAIVQVEDLAQSAPYPAGEPTFRTMADDMGSRGILCVPLLDDAGPIGAIMLHRSEAGLFTDDQVALVETFAAQAVIAIENAREFRELQTRLEREEATRDILTVISRSPDDERPVFDVILENARRLCKAPLAFMVMGTTRDSHQTLVAHHGVDDPVVDIYLSRPVPMDPDISLAARAIAEEKYVHVADVREEDNYKNGGEDLRRMIDSQGVRTIVYVPMLARDKAIGAIALFRREVAPFEDRDIEMAQAFAAQAVIAIQNVRQFRELQTRLEREEASREILGVISENRDDEQPVFDVILENAARLCDAQLAFATMVNPGRTLLEFKGSKGDGFDSFVQYLEGTPIPLDAEASSTARSVLNCEVISYDDYLNGPEATQATDVARAAIELTGVRSVVCVPLIRDGVGIGSLTIWRKEVRPFAPDQIALVETFAAQAVIAIENVRQFRELQSRLEREEATSGILSVISQSPDDDSPVFEAIHEHAARLCDAPFSGLFLTDPDGEHLNLLSHVGANPQYSVATGRKWPLTDRSAMARAVIRRNVVHISDMRDTAGYRAGDVETVRAADEEGIRTFLAVPLMHQVRAIGCIGIYRREVRPFSDDEINLVRTFAAQAVIAIENVRQFRELQTRLEREAATREILQVISQSRSDEQPVFDVILDRALMLCDAPLGLILLGAPGDTHLTPVAHRGGSDDWIGDFREHPLPRDDGATLNSRAVLQGGPQQVADLRNTELYRSANHHVRLAVDNEGMRTILSVPLIRDGVGIGTICLYRREVKAFEEREISLMETFAAQAVIAIENVRQFRELQTRLEREAASREILGVISGSRDDEDPVFDVILQNAARLCDAPMASLNILDNEGMRLVLRAHWGTALDHFEAGVTEWALDGASAPAEAMRTAGIVHIEDFAETGAYKSGDPVRVNAVEKEGIRTFLAVPFLRNGKPIGTIALFRREVKPFSADQIALVETFAAQAVIAIENVRQFRELQTRLEREQASREILGVISHSRDDDMPVFDTILENAARLCRAQIAIMALVDDDRSALGIAALHGEFVSYTPGMSYPLDANRGACIAVREARVVHRRTVQEIDDREGCEEMEADDIRAVLWVPLIQNEAAIGVLGLCRRVDQAFLDDQIALVETFAAQAVIAIENVRQFRELQTRLEREAATREILQVISRSRDDEKPVFDMILKNAVLLCGAPLASLNLLDDAGERLILRACWGDELEEMNAGATEFPLGGSSAPATAVRENRLVHIENLADTNAYRSGDPVRVRAVDVHGIRSFLAVPLMRDGKAIGCIDLFRREVSPFEDRHIELIETFAAQAVIAIENVRQFKAVIEARDDAEAALNDLKKAQERLIQAEKMASLGQLTAGIAHEIKNPLNFVNNFAKLSGELLVELGEILEEPIAALDEDDREDAEDLFRTVRENLDKINEHGRRADGIVKNMLLHSREGPSQRGTARINSIAKEALNLAYHGARAENPSFNIEMKTDLAENVGVIECYPQDLMRVFLNIISNAMYAAFKRSQEQEGFVPEITVSSRLNGGRIEVEVHDNGNGIPPEAREKIFTPFFTTKPAGEGTGLGLSLSYDIVVKQHGGDLTVDSEPGQFTAFTISLPRSLPAEIGGNR